MPCRIIEYILDHYMTRIVGDVKSKINYDHVWITKYIIIKKYEFLRFDLFSPMLMELPLIFYYMLLFLCFRLLLR